MRNTRPVVWLKSARKAFDAFPQAVQLEVLNSLSIASGGEKSGAAKPLKGIDGGVFEIAIKHRGDAYRAVYALKIDDDIWVVHAFQKKSVSGIKTPLPEINLIRDRIARLKEELK